MASERITNDGAYLVLALLKKINEWSGKPCEIKLDELGEEPPAMMLQPLARARAVRTYVDGSYIGVFAFSLYIRVNALDTRTRLDATGILNGFADWIEAKDENTREYVNLPCYPSTSNTTARSIELTSTPSIASRYDNGYEDYQAIFELKYFKTRR